MLVGVLTATQARINGELGLRLGDGFVAGFISFGSGLVVAAVVSLVARDGRRGVAVLARGMRERSIPWWMLVGGAAGALTVATQGLTVALIGVSLFTVGMIAGQAVNGLVLDRIGYGPAGVVAVTPRRLVGAALALVAVTVSVAGESLAAVPWWMLVLPFLAGIGIAWQQATNGRLRQRIGSPLTATLVNFTCGTVVLGLAAVIHVLAAGAPESYPSELWLYIGGPVSVIYIFISAAIVPQTGVLLLGLGAVVGQLLTSLAIDAIWPAVAGPGVGQALLMVSIALLSVAVVAVPRRRPAR